MSAGNSSNSSVSGRSSSNSSDTSAETVTRQQPHVFNLSQSPQQPMYYQYYRRQTPEEDYLSTQQAHYIYMDSKLLASIMYWSWAKIKRIMQIALSKLV